MIPFLSEHIGTFVCGFHFLTTRRITFNLNSLQHSLIIATLLHMITQCFIDNAFKSCQDGSLVVSSLPSEHAMSIRNIDGCSVLEVAIECKHVDLIRELLKFDFLVTPFDQCSALAIATKTGDCKIVQMVFDHIGDVCFDEVDEALVLACKLGHFDIFCVLFSVCSASDTDLNPLLFEACVRGHADIAQELINAGADAHLNPESDSILSNFESNFVEDICRYRRDLPLHSQFVPDTTIDVLASVLAVLVPAGLVLNHWCGSAWGDAGSSGSTALADLYLARGRAIPARYQGFVQQALAGACAYNQLHVVQHILGAADAAMFTPDVGALLDAIYDYSPARMSTTHVEVITELLRVDSAPDVAANDLLLYASAAGLARGLAT
jgi:hypothetical protein